MIFLNVLCISVCECLYVLGVHMFVLVFVRVCTRVCMCMCLCACTCACACFSSCICRYKLTYMLNVVKKTQAHKHTSWCICVYSHTHAGDLLLFSNVSIGAKAVQKMLLRSRWDHIALVYPSTNIDIYLHVLTYINIHTHITPFTLNSLLHKHTQILTYANISTHITPFTLNSLLHKHVQILTNANISTHITHACTLNSLAHTHARALRHQSPFRKRS